MSSAQKAVILLSGGLDSTTVLATACAEGFEAYALSFNYGQRHNVELHAARRIAETYQVKQHLIIDIPARIFGESALTSATEVPKNRDEHAISHGIPVTYVPARNTLFLSYALAWCESLHARHIFIGVNAVDYSGYPDCRPEYIEAYQRMANLATQQAVEQDQTIQIHTPLADLSKAEIIQKGLALGVDYSLTNSCYDPSPDGTPCGACDACQLREKGFSALGLEDPK